MIAPNKQQFLIGLHFELPAHPAFQIQPYVKYYPPGNLVGTQIVSGWIVRELEQAGLTVPEGIGAAFGELNCCTGCWSVSDLKAGLLIVQRVVQGFYAADDYDAALEIGWWCAAECIWRMWRPTGSSADFARHLTPEVRERSMMELVAVQERMRAALKTIRRPTD